MEGYYSDCIQTESGTVVFRGVWHPNTIVDSAWMLIAELLANKKNIGGIGFLAVGAGDASWDQIPPGKRQQALQLYNETGRFALEEKNIRFLDSNGLESKESTPWVEFTIQGSWSDKDVELREFGLVGGNASTAPDTGTLVNYVTHPVLMIKKGNVLTRLIRLHMRPSVQRRVLELADGAIAQAPIEAIDGIASTTAKALKEAGIDTLGKLSLIDPSVRNYGLPTMRLVEWRARARTVLFTIINLAAPPEILGVHAGSFLTSGINMVAQKYGVPPESITVLYEQLSLMQACLDDSFIGKVTIGELIAMK